MASEEKLQIRRAIKKRKPTYLRRQANQFAKLKKINAWRRPKGMGNKSRRNKRGHIGMLQVGYGSPKEVKGTNRDGYYEIVVSNMNQLFSLDTATQVGVLSKTLGQKKRLELVKAAQKENITISNVKDLSHYIKTIEESVQAKKDAKNKSQKAKTQSKKENKKEDKKESSSEESESDEKSQDTKTKTSDDASKSNTATTKQTQDTTQSSSSVKKTTTTKTTTKSSTTQKGSSSDTTTSEVNKK